MSNMSYCRFENTYHDLIDCYNHLDDNTSSSEEIYKENIIKLCREIANNAEIED